MRSLSFFFILFFILVSSCDRRYPDCPARFLRHIDDRLTIINSTSEEITYTFSYDYPEDSLRLDQLVPGEQTVNANPATNVGPNDSKKYQARSCWEFTFANYIPSGKLRLLIFNRDTIKTYPATEIIRRGLYRSYLYTLDDLRELDWQAVYP